MGIEPSMERRRIGHQSTELLIPPSAAAALLKKDSRSTETTLLVTRAPSKDLKLISPPWRKQGKTLELRMAESGDSSNIDDRDKYRTRYDERRDQREQARRVANDRQDVDNDIPNIKSVDSLTLISNPPSIKEKNKGLLSRIKKKVSPKIPVFIQPKREAVELVLVSLTKDKMTVQLNDGNTKIKIHTKCEKEKAPVKLNTVDEQIKNKDDNDQPDVIGTSEPAKGVMDAIFGDEKAKNKEEDDESISLGPDDIPHEVSYRTQPSMSSIVFNDIPSAASWPSVSDVSGSSSDSSDWSSFDDFPPMKNHGQLVKVTNKKKWNKKIAPLARQLSYPIVKASSPMVKAFIRKTDSFY